jgi:hypothetical protein
MSKGKSTATAGGSMAFKQNTPKSKSPGMGGSSDVKALGRASGGKIETSPGRRHVGGKFDRGA